MEFLTLLHLVLLHSLPSNAVMTGLTAEREAVEAQKAAQDQERALQALPEGNDAESEKIVFLIVVHTVTL